VVLLDGGSGAGKTSLAAQIAQAWRDARDDELQVVSLDDVYPGWEGLAAASAAVPRILAAHGPGYRRWNWDISEPAGWVGVDPRRPILVEGCGSLTRESSGLATCRIWLEADESVRKQRALARDQGGFDPYWDLWATEERAHWEANHPRELADLVARSS
jgi:uridine kinase